MIIGNEDGNQYAFARYSNLTMLLLVTQAIGMLPTTLSLYEPDTSDLWVTPPAS